MSATQIDRPLRPRDPRRLLTRRRDARARVTLIDSPVSEASAEEGVTTRQCAEVLLPREELERLWSPEHLERLARTYWRYLSRVSLGLLRVLYTPSSREIVLLRRPLVLLRFHAPDYETSSDHGVVTWPIDRGLLVAPAGRGKGFLRLSVERRPGPDSEHLVAFVTSEVANFYPLIAGWGWFAHFGRFLYRITQYRIHIIVTHAFLRSLARLDLAPSKVGAMRSEQVVDETP